MTHVELDFKSSHMDWSEFIQDGVGRNDCQKNKSHPILFHSQFWCFYFRKHIESNRLELLLPCSVYFYPPFQKPYSQIYLRPFCEWSDKQKGSLVTSKEPFRMKIQKFLSCFHYLPPLLQLICYALSLVLWRFFQ